MAMPGVLLEHAIGECAARSYPDVMVDKVQVRILSPSDGDEIDFRGAVIRRKASRSETDGHWAIGTGRQSAGFDNPRHVHDEPEAFYVLRGLYTFYTESGEVEAGPGTFVLIPPGAVHGFRTEADDSELLCVWPSTVEDSFFGS